MLLYQLLGLFHRDEQRLFFFPLVYSMLNETDGELWEYRTTFVSHLSRCFGYDDAPVIVAD